MPGNRIHPRAFVGPHVMLGTGNTIGPFAVVAGNTTIGDDNWIGPGATVGTPAQMKGGVHGAWDEGGPFGIQIGSGNVIREHATVHEGTERTTFVGDQCYLMTGAHIPHDAHIENGVILANSVHLGGHTWVGEGANLGLAVVVHQRTAVGAGAMIGMNSTVTKDIPPFALAIGSPARIRKANTVGLERLGIDSALIAVLDEAYRTGAPVAEVPPALSGFFANYNLQVRISV